MAIKINVADLCFTRFSGNFWFDRHLWFKRLVILVCESFGNALAGAYLRAIGNFNCPSFFQYPAGSAAFLTKFAKYSLSATSACCATQFARLAIR